MLVRKGLCNIVSRVGAEERMKTMWADSSVVGSGIVGDVAGGWDVVL
jgi:hypothetical protein